MSAAVTIAPYAATQKNGQIVCNILCEDLLRDVMSISRAMVFGQEDGVTNPDHVWPDTSIAWHCDSAITAVIRDLEAIKGQAISSDDLSARIFQVESTLTVIRAVAPESAGYVCRCLDSAITLAGVAGRLILDCIEKEKPVSPQIEPEIKRSRKATAKTQEVAA